MNLSMVISVPTEPLSHTLKEKTPLQEARNAALVTKAFLQKQRMDSAFEQFYGAVVTASQSLTDECVVPRHHKHIPSNYNDARSL